MIEKCRTILQTCSMILVQIQSQYDVQQRLLTILSENKQRIQDKLNKIIQTLYLLSASQYEGAQTKIEALEKTVVKYKEQIQLLDRKLTIFQQNNSVLFSFSSSHNPPSSPSSTPNINQIFHDNLNLLSKCYDELLAAQSHFHVCFFFSDPCSLVSNA